MVPPPTGSFRPAPSSLNREAADMPSAAATADTSTDQPREVVLRPTGLRHGRWEAPPWAFWTTGVLVLAIAGIYAFLRAKKRA